VCIPEPFWPKIGLGMNVARNPCRYATFRTTNRNVARLSAVSSGLGVAEVDLVLPGAHLVVPRFDFDPHQRRDPSRSGGESPRRDRPPCLIEITAAIVRDRRRLTVRIQIGRVKNSASTPAIIS